MGKKVGAMHCHARAPREGSITSRGCKEYGNANSTRIDTIEGISEDQRKSVFFDCLPWKLLGFQRPQSFRRHGFGMQIAEDDLVPAVVENPAQEHLVFIR